MSNGQHRSFTLRCIQQTIELGMNDIGILLRVEKDITRGSAHPVLRGRGTSDAVAGRAAINEKQSLFGLSNAR